MDQKVGIYQIGLQGILPRILYVGQSQWIEARWKQHQRYLLKNKHHNPHLQNIYNKYGGGFTYAMLEECRISELDEKEQYYIDTLKPECNIVLDVKKFWERKLLNPETILYDTDVLGLEIDWKPKKWHRWVYGDHVRV